MANSKNTIQNIPLEAPLCMNQLRTEVKPFQGYNEKNTTVYGGTLSPIYDNKTKLFDKDNSYTTFNSKGVPYTLVKEGSSIKLYEGTTKINSSDYISYVTNIEELDVPDNALAAAKMLNGDVVHTMYDGELKYFRVYINNELFYTNRLEYQVVNVDVIFSRIWKDPDDNDAFFVGYISKEYDVIGNGNYFGAFIVRLKKSNPRYESYAYTRIGASADSKLEPILTGGKVDDTMKFAFMANSGSFNSTGYFVRTTTFNNSSNLFQEWDNTVGRKFYIEHATSLRLFSKDVSSENSANQFAVRAVTKVSDTKYTMELPEYTVGVTYSVPTADGKIECPYTNLASYDTGYLRFVYKDSSLICIGNLSIPIEPFFSFKKSCVYLENSDPGKRSFTGNITYQKNDGKWYNYSSTKVKTEDTLSVEELKSLVYMNRYVRLYEDNNSYLPSFYDMEKQKIIRNLDLSWVDCWPPLFESSGSEKGVVYGAGMNAGYMVSNAELVGYLPNPYVGTVEGGKLAWSVNKIFKNPEIQSYYTIGNTVQSAKYQGDDPQYYDTVYPIDPNGNIVLPISQNAELINGYSNNDMVKEGSTVYPLMYWNNNQKTYSYFLLAGIENVTNVFSLQGQQYAVDDENIYMVAFNGGVVSQVQSVSYKKNLTFLGTLPTQTVFWSDFNKTFYAFTGDRILSKMFEASDINKIYFVGQNPSSLSLWICTDTGVYVLSDSDMFKLDYISKTVGFQPKNTLLLTEGETDNEVHAISLYLNEGEVGEMIPVKLQTAYYGLGNEMKAVMDCWYLRLFDENNTKGYVKAKVHTITDITRHTEEKTFEVNPSDYDENHIVYLRFQPKYQECVSMQLELETNLGIYQISLGVNTTDSTAQVSKFNF